MNERGKTGELRALTGFRFVAAFYVFAFHIQIRWPLVTGGLLGNFLSEGALGMTMFFMLSGFILAYRYGRKDFDAIEFLQNRIGRIWPVFMVAALLALPWLVLQLRYTPHHFGELQLILQLGILVIAAAFMMQAWVPMLFTYWNNSASWSLSTEAFFYLAFIPIIRVARQLGTRGIVGMLVVTYLFSLLPPLAYIAFENRPTEGLQIFYAMPIFRLGEFVIGVLLFLLLRQMPLQTKYFTRIAALLCIFCTAYVALLGSKLPIYVAHNWIVIPAVGAALIALSNGEGSVATVLASRPMVWLGRISYCFYSFQFHVLSVLQWFDRYYHMSAGVHFVIALAILLGISALAYRFVEEPARHWFRRRVVMQRFEELVPKIA